MAVATRLRPALPSLPAPLSLRRPTDAALAAVLAAGFRLLLGGLGMVPVTLIALSTFGLSLRSLAVHVALPALAVLGVLVATRRVTGALAASALRAGVVATAVYDASRFGFMLAGAVDHDPIPHIGTALGLEPAAVFGYLWRYLGNGTGLALAFLALGLRGVRAGVVYGLAVCTGLLVTLVVSPRGEELLFALAPGTVLMATVGHAIFGWVLGSLAGPQPTGRAASGAVVRLVAGAGERRRIGSMPEASERPRRSTSAAGSRTTTFVPVPGRIRHRARGASGAPPSR